MVVKYNEGYAQELRATLDVQAGCNSVISFLSGYFKFKRESDQAAGFEQKEAFSDSWD